MKSHQRIRLPQAALSLVAVGITCFVCHTESSRTQSLVASGLASSIVVTDFGAVGDGSTDDTAAIQLAFQTAHSSGVAHVHFPAGRYVISSNLSTGPKVCITGEGEAATTIQNIQATAGFLVYLGGLTGGPVTAEVSDITIDGGQTSNCCLFVDGGVNCRFKSVHVTGYYGVGIWVAHSRNTIVADCTSDAPSEKSGHAILMGNDSHYAVTVRNRVANPRESGLQYYKCAGIAARSNFVHVDDFTHSNGYGGLRFATGDDSQQPNQDPEATVAATAAMANVVQGMSRGLFLVYNGGPYGTATRHQGVAFVGNVVSGTSGQPIAAGGEGVAISANCSRNSTAVVPMDGCFVGAADPAPLLLGPHVVAGNVDSAPIPGQYFVGVHSEQSNLSSVCGNLVRLGPPSILVNIADPVHVVANNLAAP